MSRHNRGDETCVNVNIVPFVSGAAALLSEFLNKMDKDVTELQY